MIKSEYKNVKMILRVKLLGEKSIKIKFVRIHPDILKYPKKEFFYSREQVYTFSKSHYLTLITPTRLTIPTLKTGNSLTSYTFRNPEERYRALKRLNKALLEFSYSNHFKLINKVYDNNRIKYLNHNWIVY